MNRIQNIIFLFLCGTVICIFLSCQNAPRDIPFPAEETEFPQPVSSAFTFSAGERVKWETAKPDSTKPFKEIKIDFEKLRSEPFALSDFKPMPGSVKETKFDLDDLPDTLFDLDRIPAKKITFKISQLGQPARSKATRPRIRDNATQGIFEYGVDQGLNTGGGINNIFQDSRGFLWIGTLNGVYRFDGENFDLYTAAQGLFSFNSTEVFSEDGQGQIWIGNENGIDILNPEEGILKHLGTPQGLSSDIVKGFMIDRSGKMWVGTDNGINIIDPKTGILKILSVAQGISQNDIAGLQEDNEGNVWLGAKAMIYIIETDKKRLKRLTNAGNLYNRFFKDDQGRILIRNSGGTVDMVDLKSVTIKKSRIRTGIDY